MNHILIDSSNACSSQGWTRLNPKPETQCGLHIGCRSLCTWAIILYFPKFISKQVDQSWSSQNTNGLSNKVSWYCIWWLKMLCHDFPINLYSQRRRKKFCTITDYTTYLSYVGLCDSGWYSMSFTAKTKLSLIPY